MRPRRSKRIAWLIRADAHRVLGDENRAHDARREVRPDGQDDRHPVVVLDESGEALVDAERDEGRTGDLQGRADDDHDHGRDDLSADGPQQ